MGLNWAEGLKAAGKGVGQMAGMKMQEADYLYKEMAQQNRQRFEAQQAQEQRDFLSSEKETERDWKLENEIPLKEKEIEQRGELAILGQKSLDTQRAIENQLRKQANDIQQQRANTSASDVEADTEMARERLLSDQKKLVDEKWEGFDDSYQARMLKKNDPEAYQAKLVEKQDDYVLASLLPSQQSHYIDAQKGMTGLNAAARREIGKAYATMTPEQRDQVWKSLPQKASGKDFGEAVRSVKSGKAPAPSAQKGAEQPPPKVEAPKMQDAEASIFKDYNQPQETQMASTGKQEDFLQGAMRG